MKKHLLVLYASLIAALIAALIVEYGYFKVYDTLYVKGFIVGYLCLCLPLLLIWGFSIYMGRALSRKASNNKLVFPKFSLNFQITFSIAYIYFVGRFFFHVVLVTASSAPVKVNDCSESNLNSLSMQDETLSRKYIMAYNSLKQVLRMNAQNSSDTNVCLERTLSQTFDTVIDGNRMNTKIILTMGVADKDDGTFRYLFCCNDSVGFQICSYPFPKINATTNN